MILCVSLNPAVDKRMRLERLQLQAVNRARDVRPAPGGKAAHVAMVLKTLGAEVTWLGFTGGHSGEVLLNGLHQLAIQTVAVPTASPTRTNLEIIDEAGVTEILEPGAPISDEEMSELHSVFGNCLTEAKPGNSVAVVVLSGSLPQGAPADCYKNLIDLAHRSGCSVFVDTGGEPFRSALSAKPDFIKPNRDEAKMWSGREVDSPAAALTVLNDMLSAGAAAGAISLGPQGMIWRAPNEKPLLAKAPAVSGRSAVGSGDSALAAFAYAAQQRMGPGDSLRLAAACGAANCLAQLPGQASIAEISRMKEQIIVESFNCT
jgi:1-phosphofructokinase family hexose kinase